jgi:hypothetical protein
MANQMGSFLALQVAVYVGWAKWVGQSSKACARVIEHQAQLFERPRHIRCTNVAPTGADWLDHYGKRHSDVDVERV